MDRNLHLRQTVVLGEQRRGRDDPEKIHRVAPCRNVQISGKRHQDKEQVADKVREAGESDFQPGDDRPQEWLTRLSGAEQEEIALRGVARRPSDGPTERDRDNRERGDEPMHRLCGAIVGRRPARRGGAGRHRLRHLS